MLKLLAFASIMGGLVGGAHAQNATPPDQDNFVKMVELTRDRRDITDAQRKEIVNARMVLLCGQARTGSIVDWVGTVWFTGQTPNGKRTLGVALTKNISVETWEAPSTGRMPAEETLIDSDSPLGKDIAKLRQGDRVRFSGSFASDGDRCIYAHRGPLTEQIARPAFVMKFRSVQPAEDGPRVTLRDKPSIASRGYPATTPAPEPRAASIVPVQATGSAHSSDSLPRDQVAFMLAVSKGQRDFRSAPNEMAAGGTRAERKKILCQILQRNKAITGWVGKVTTLSTSNDGRGVLVIEIAKDVAIGTWNNSLSDVMDNTLIEPGSDVFRSAVALKKGDMVAFSGVMIADDDDCVRETSVTLSGSMKDPLFLLRFRSVKKL